MKSCIVRVLNVDYLLIPSLQMFVVVTSQQLHQRPIYYLNFSISTRIECSGVLKIGIHSLPKNYPKYIQELVVLVKSDGGWQSEVYLDMDEK